MSEDYPLVSIVTPSYNQAAYLEETIRSVLTQDYPRIEYLVVDGCSTDGSIDIIRQYAERLTYWVSEPDSGQAQAINKGLRRSSGDIVGWLNSDDQYNPGAVRSAVAALQTQPDHDLVYSDCDYVDEAGHLFQHMVTWDFIPRRMLTGLPTIIQPASFFRQRALKRVGYLDENLHYLIDHDLYVRMIVAGLTFLKVDATWARFRWHSSSKTFSQWVGFNLELQQIVERTYATPSTIARPEWRREARANVWQWLGEAYLKSGQRRRAQSALLKAISADPIRPKSLMALALLLDALLGTRLSTTVRRWRYRLPDVPAGAEPFEGMDR